MKIIRKLKGEIKYRGGIIPVFYHYSGIDKKWDDEKFIRYRYKAVFKREPNLDNPTLFSEKMQWLKLHNHQDSHTAMVDKYLVRSYVADRIGEQYIIPLIGVWNSVDEIDFSKLPCTFVLKTTHDSGGIVICNDRGRFDIDKAKEKLQRRFKKNYYYVGREWNYKNVTPRIIAEEYLENDAAEGLHDYKVWCFNGRAEYVQYITGRIANVTYEGFYDRNWKLQSFSYHNPLMKTAIPKPEKLDELLYVAEKLAQGLPFGRIDFYILPSGDIKFGEITFFPMGGTEHWKPEAMDLKLGEKITLPPCNTTRT